MKPLPAWLDFKMGASDRPDMARATIVNNYNVRMAYSLERGKPAPCRIQLTIVGPVSIQEMFIGERYQGRAHLGLPDQWIWNCDHPQLVTFNGESKFSLDAGQSAVSDPINWNPKGTGEGIVVSFSTDSDTSPPVGSHNVCNAYFKRETDEASKREKSAGYIHVPKSSFAVAAIEVVQ